MKYKQRLIAGLISFLMVFSISLPVIADSMSNTQTVLLDDSFTPKTALAYAIGPNHLSPFIYQGENLIRG